MINEERSFYWRLTGAQNLEFFGALDNLPRAVLQDRIALLLDVVGLGRASDRRVSDYSAGMKQRLAIARGLLCDPDILLLDEPTKSLDIEGASEVRELIRNDRVGGGARTVVIATNSLHDVTGLCGRLAIVNHSRIVASVVNLGSSEKEIEGFYRSAVLET